MFYNVNRTLLCGDTIQIVVDLQIDVEFKNIFFKKLQLKKIMSGDFYLLSYALH